MKQDDEGSADVMEVRRRRHHGKPLLKGHRQVLHGRLRRDDMGIMLLALSAFGVALNGVVFPRLGRTGGILQQVSTGILFGRAAYFTTSGKARRQRPLPRVFTVMELEVDGIATVAGFWAWVWQPFLSRRVTRRTAVHRRTGQTHHTVWGGATRTAKVSRAAATASFVFHTGRLAIYLTPSRGLQEDAKGVGSRS